MPSGLRAPGADDNGSGTVAVLEAARVLSPFEFDYTIRFIAFDEEEIGLVEAMCMRSAPSNRNEQFLAY